MATFLTTLPVHSLQSRKEMLKFLKSILVQWSLDIVSRTEAAAWNLREEQFGCPIPGILNPQTQSRGQKSVLTRDPNYSDTH